MTMVRVLALALGAASLLAACTHEARLAPSASPTASALIVTATAPTTATSATPVVLPTSSETATVATGSAPPTASPRPTALASSGAAWRQIAIPLNGFQQPNAQWIEVDAPNGRTLLAVVVRPAGGAPAPVVVMLHTAGGFEGPAVRGVANDLAAAGFLVVAGCWFKGWYDPPGYPPTDPVAKSQRLIDCPNAPPYDGWNPTSAGYAEALAKAARTLPRADGRHVALLGGSAGASASVLLGSIGADVQAIVADSADYTRAGRTSTLLISVADRLSVPLLMVHGKADPDTTFQEALDYEAVLKRLGKAYETKYVEGAGHVVLQKDKPYYIEVMNTVVAFLKRTLA